MLVVIDGLGDQALKNALRDGHAPHLQALIDAGAAHAKAISPFPSLTPVCLSTIATGSLPDEHRIPSLTWFQRGEHRFVEYGSSFAASSAQGTARMIEDVMANLNLVHLAEEPRTIFEITEDAGIVAASVNHLIWRGRHRHPMKYAMAHPVATKLGVQASYGPTHLYMGELFGSWKTLPQTGIKRPSDRSGSLIAKYLMNETDAGFILLYLGQHDVASHKLGPDFTQRAVRIADRAVERVMEAMGGIEAFTEQCAFVLCADHGQTQVEADQHCQLEDAFPDLRLFRGGKLGTAGDEDAQLAIAPSNRAALIYRLGDDAPTNAEVADRLNGEPAVDIVGWLDTGEMHVRRGPYWLRAVRTEAHADGAHAVDGEPAGLGTAWWRLDGDSEALDMRIEGGVIRYGVYPDALDRLAAILHCVNAGDLAISATPGWEFIDLGGSRHTGGSHGSLHEVDSTAPLITFGLDHGAGVTPGHSYRLADVAGLVRTHFGI